MVEDALEVGIHLLERAQCLVESVTDVVVYLIAEVLPPRSRRYKDGVGVILRRVRALDGLGWGYYLVGNLVSASGELVGASLQEEHPKMNSLDSEASILPRRMSAPARRWRSSQGRVSWFISVESDESVWTSNDRTPVGPRAVLVVPVRTG